MKIRELNRNILHNASQIQQEDFLFMLNNCYQRTLTVPEAERSSKIDTCLSKWRKVYFHLDSQEALDSYTDFYQAIRK